ncbi:MAG: long-chain fatty acid--CoA ligase [Betaproteobacteria bacterium]|nr:long-chain fatty acid--CoA ligase [Betaproteobacteria bacterium]
MPTTTETTFPRVLLQHAQQRPERPAYREKYLGIWQTDTWKQAADNVRKIACGLASLGFQRGMSLGIVGDNRPHLYQAMLAAQSLGGVAVPLYQDAVAAEMVYVLQDAEVQFAFAEDQEQVDKLLEVSDQLANLHNVFYLDPRGLRNYDHGHLKPIEELMELGSQYNAAHPEFFDAEVAKGQSTDVCVILYTSGTTGRPKGVCQTHASMLGAGRGACEVDSLNDQDDMMAYLPMAWVGDFLFSMAQCMASGFTVNCPESRDTVSADMKEIGPTYYFAPPRVYEGLLTSVTIRMEDAGRIKKSMYDYFMGVAARCGADLLDGHPVGMTDRLLYALGRLFVFGPLRNTLGMSRIRVAYTAGEAIGPDLFKFYRSIGVNLKQLYGQTESCAYACIQRDGQVKYDSVGSPSPGMEIKIGENSEVLVRGVSLLKEYYKRPDATAEAIDSEGYFHTGDAGVLDNDGHLRIIDRAKDVSKMASGKVFAPKYIENKLKFFSYIKEAVVFGADRDFIGAFINIDFEAVGNWAERRNIPYSGYIDLAGNPAVSKLVSDCIEKMNRELSGEKMLGHAQISRFLVLHKELDPDDDELTRTRKVRRGFVEEKYKPLIQAIYGGLSEQFIETDVRFEDGRIGRVSATLKVLDVPTFALQKEAAA